MAKGVRKVYVVIQDNHIFNVSNYQSVDIYRKKEDAERICQLKQKEAIEDAQLMWNVNKPIPQYKVHGFYLMHEALFNKE
jgi:hypothetical protein